MTPIAATLALALTMASPSESPVDLTTPTGVIHGTLSVPAGDAKVPVVLIIAGSGPTDRDGNSPLIPGKNNCYKMLADALAADGVASLRYDKRGIAASRPAGPIEADLRFDMYVDDAAGWIRQLRADARFSTIIVAGHSEGSLIGMLAASKAKADGFVSIAGVAQRASDVVRDQLRPQLSAMPALWDASDAVLQSLEKGQTLDTLPKSIQAVPALSQLFRPSVQPYLISWFRYQPSAILAELTMPVLIIQGTHDVQVSVDEAKALKIAKPDAQLLLVDGMNHVMKAAPADRLANISTYGRPDLPIVADVPKAIGALARK